MATVIEKTLYTPEDLLKIPEGKHYELVDGQLVEREMSLRACEVAANIIYILGNYTRRRDLGGVYSSEVGYQCFPEAPNKVRKPDVSFIRKDRLSAEMTEGHVPIPPDLAVEVVSPGDSYYDVMEKVREYLRAGVRLVWVLDPNSRVLEIYRVDGAGGPLDDSRELSGEDVIPGFACKVVDLFETALHRQS
jgi:Uma2 family endonuclease